MILNCYLATSLDFKPPLVHYLLTTNYLLPTTSDIDPTTIIIIITIALEDDYSSSSSAALFPFASNHPDLDHVSCVSYPIVLFYFILLSVFNESLMFMHEGWECSSPVSLNHLMFGSGLFDNTCVSSSGLDG